jgi:tetratricopeptide (TPR) repeat protein
MGFDKAKVMRAAEKYLAQGKIPSAIKEYQQIVEHDLEDFSALNMLGDLLVRTNQQEEAIKVFVRVAEHYREEGFALKAIAMYKKIDRLKPGNIEIAAKLAPLYEMQGLIVDARTQYLLVADAYSRGGQTAKALEVLSKIADLDPNNTEIRLKLAEGYERENFRNDAAEAFAHAGAQLYARGALDHALDAYTRALHVVPNHQAALSGLTSTHIARGTADEAAEILQNALVEQPDDKELLSLLAHAHVEAENAPAAERATAALVEQEPSSIKRFVEVIRLYLKAGDSEATTRLLTRIVEPMLTGNEEETFAGLLNEILSRNPEQIEALRLLVRVHTWQHDDEKLRGALERLAEAAEVAGLADEERSTLAKLVRLAPDEPGYRERFQELGGAAEEFESESGFTVVGAEEEVPTFESFMPMSEEMPPAAPVEEPAQFEWNAVGGPPSDPSSSFADLNDEWAEAGTADNAQPAPTGYQEFDFNETAATPTAPPVEAAKPSSDGATDKQAMLGQELESVDFYLAQGYADIALDTLNMLERQFGTHPEIESRRAQVEQAMPAPEAAAPAETVAVADSLQSSLAEESPAEVKASAPAVTAPAVTAPAASASGIDPGLAAIFDEFKTAVEDESDAPLNGDYETHYNLGLAYKEMDLLDESVEEFQTAASLVTPRDGTPRYLQCCNLLGHCFMQKGMPRVAVMWFKRGLDAPGHTEDEYQALRFDLGTAYEQMGDLDQAIDVFSEVYGINVSYRGVSDKLRELQSQKATK